MLDSIFEEMRPPGLSGAEFARRSDNLVDAIVSQAFPPFVWNEQPDGSSICDLGSFRVAQVQHASGGQYRAYDLLADPVAEIGGLYARIDLAEAAAEAHIRKYLEDANE